MVKETVFTRIPLKKTKGVNPSARFFAKEIATGTPGSPDSAVKSSMISVKAISRALAAVKAEFAVL